RHRPGCQAADLGKDLFVRATDLGVEGRVRRDPMEDGPGRRRPDLLDVGRVQEDLHRSTPVAWGKAAILVSDRGSRYRRVVTRVAATIQMRSAMTRCGVLAKLRGQALGTDSTTSAAAATATPSEPTTAGVTGGGGAERAGARPSRTAIAAVTNPSNSGCGRSGRDLNSGWNWLATNHGWSRSSTISTRRPSGDWPESVIPAAS